MRIVRFTTASITCSSEFGSAIGVFILIAPFWDVCCVGGFGGIWGCLVGGERFFQNDKRLGGGESFTKNDKRLRLVKGLSKMTSMANTGFHQIIRMAYS